ncbi:MAG: hypothetical protein JWN15_1420 [Firmicutes bacterium]|nr:hypothetical protein [Bacillota bacterium]
MGKIERVVVYGLLSPNNLAGTPYSQFYWVEDSNARSLTLFGIKGNLVNGQFKIGQDKIGSLNY